MGPDYEIAGSGGVPSALTDLRDVGRFVAEIIGDDRTRNKFVLVYGEMWTQNQEKVSGETVLRQHVLEGEIAAGMRAAMEKAASQTDLATLGAYWIAQYVHSWGIRGDNTPEYAKYLGYVTRKELYPDFKYEEFVKEVLDGKVPSI
jgi:hypothetical protein